MSDQFNGPSNSSTAIAAGIGAGALVLLLLAVELAQRRGTLAEKERRRLLEELACLPARLEQLLERNEAVEA
ncbi:hypothetical protein LCGC14_2250170, partial [marine sediment metagenome]